MLYFILFVLLFILCIPVLFVLGVALFYRKRMRLSENFSQIYEEVQEMMKKGQFDFESLGGQRSKKVENHTATGSMSKSEAREILGLEPNASKSDINKAYHALIQKLHPDKGGSKYLTQQLNKARDVLIK